jgi:hypothetical protein
LIRRKNIRQQHRRLTAPSRSFLDIIHLSTISARTFYIFIHQTMPENRRITTETICLLPVHLHAIWSFPETDRKYSEKSSGSSPGAIWTRLDLVEFSSLCAVGLVCA